LKLLIMNRRFSKEELYLLRNKIPIELLIKETLKIPSKNTQGIFRFLCPSCNDFYTSVNYKKNLAKCFSCKNNFNTIEMVIEVKKTPFVQAVKFLQEHYEKFCRDDKMSVQSPCFYENDIRHYSADNTISKRQIPEIAVPISEIMPGLLQKIPYNDKKQKNDSSHKSHHILKKLEQIEQDLNKIVREIKQIKEFF